MKLDKVQQLKEEIQQSVLKSLSESDVGKILKRYNLSGDGAIKIECILDTTKLQPSDSSQNPEDREIVLAERIVIVASVLQIPCKADPEDYPDGCWV